MISSNNKYKYTDISQLYEFFEVLGEGSFSKVYKAKFLPSGEMIAVKVSILNYA
jgi:serine/threonine protein kinase